MFLDFSLTLVTVRNLKYEPEKRVTGKYVSRLLSTLDPSHGLLRIFSVGNLHGYSSSILLISVLGIMR